MEFLTASVLVGVGIGFLVGAWVVTQLYGATDAHARVAETPDTDPRDT